MFCSTSNDSKVNASIRVINEKSLNKSKKVRLNTNKRDVKYSFNKTKGTEVGKSCVFTGMNIH